MNNVEAYYPLSPLQKGLYFHSKLDDRSGVYVVQFICDLHGRLDTEAWQRAWQGLVDRHPSLRTAFVGEGEDALQVVGKHVRLPWIEVDWRSMDAASQVERYQKDLEADLETGFDLSRAPLMRCCLIRLGDRHYRFRWSHHHLLVDGWSVSRLIEEASSRYGLLRRGRTPRLPSVRPYMDYIAWLQQKDSGEAELFWRRTLAGFESPTELVGIDRGPRPGAGLEYRETKRVVAASATSRVRRWGRRHRVTLNTLVQGAWSLLLSRYSGARDVLFGIVVSGRPPELEGVESMVGLFINTLPLRVEVNDQTPLGTWLERLQDQTLKMREYEHTPLVQSKQWSEVPPGQPFFETVLIFENYPTPRNLNSTSPDTRQPLPEDTDDRIRVGTPEIRDHPHYLLNLLVAPGDELVLQLGYDGSRIDSKAADRLLAHLETLLHRIATSEADQHLSRLSMLSVGERHLLVNEFNATERRDEAFAASEGVDERILRRVKRRPDAVAVCCGGQNLTYGRLEREAAVLARRLHRQGVGMEDRVAILSERTPQLLVAVLAVWRAGGAYVPIDPAWPRERIGKVLESSGARVILTETGGGRFWRESGHTVVELQAPQVAEPSDLAPVPGGADRLAYVIYTSGSTGEPKGVEVSHRALSNFLESMRRQPGLEAADRLLAVTTLSFDISTLELFLPLLCGARIVLVDRESAADAGALRRLLAEVQISVMQATPATWRLLLEDGWPGDPELNVLCGGEALSEDLARFLTEHCRSLWNLYGPTETTVWSSRERVCPEFEGISVGRPIANTQLYVLDPDRRLLPVGSVGEVWIGGSGLARGYRARPGLTAERFIPHPWSQQPGDRLYQTGDLGLFRPNGHVEILGRQDHQVKIRGFRVELGDVEAGILKCPGVGRAAVVARPDASGETALVAFVVAAPGDELPGPESLRQELLNHLPSYMVPSLWRELGELPLNSSGKVDRPRLADLSSGRMDPRRGARIAPRTSTERAIGEIWEDVLKIEGIGAEESFFALGGHSLLAGQVMARIRERLGADLPLRSLFDHPTLSDLATVVDEAQGASRNIRKPRLRSLPREEGRAFPMSFSQQRLWFLYRMQPASPAYNIPTAVRLRGELSIQSLRQALTEIVRRHEILRTTFAHQVDKPVQRVRTDPEVHLPVADLRMPCPARRETELEELMQSEARRPFDLSRGPVVRQTLIVLGENLHVLLLTVHHIAFDGWSAGILVRELAALYENFFQGDPSRLSELEIQYADFADWQRRWLSGETLEQELDYWREELEDIPPLLKLPGDRPRPPVQSFEGGSVSFAVPASVAAEVRKLAQARRATLFMVVLATFDILLWRYSDQNDIVIGAPVANRDRVEIEGVIGFFVNTLILRLRKAPVPEDFLACVERAREVTLRAHAHQDLPFEKLVEHLKPRRSLSHAPLLQVAVSVQNTPRQPLEFPGLSLEPLAVNSGTAKMDLHLDVLEAGEALKGSLEFNSDLFDATTAERMVGHLLSLLQGIVENPKVQISELPLLSQAERHRVLVEWNDSSVSSPGEPRVLELFTEQVASRPASIAVEFGHHLLEYRDLDQRSHRLAGWLHQHGVGPEVRVGICTHHSPQFVVAVLAVLKAGGVFVPLDPTYPEDRLRFMVADSGIRWLLTEESLRGRLPEDLTELFFLDTGDGVSSFGASMVTPTRPDREAAAYVIYTSGSTGRPKGVVVPHRGLYNMALALGRRYRIASDARLLQFSSLSFDSAMAEIFGTLLAGGTLVMALREALLPGPHLVDFLWRERISHVTLPPSALAVLPTRPLPTLNVLISAGEACSADLVDRWSPGRQFLNAYGPTEGSVCATVATCDPSHRPPTIGRPIDNVRMFVLSGHLQPTPIGVLGEFHLGGEGIARGYLGRPGLTAQRFVPHPFSPGGERLYRTGDLGRWRPDGALEFHGRGDQQVKLRGYRIELEEIESVLTAHPEVAEGIVELRQVGGDKGLAAYVTPAGGKHPEVSGLRGHLQESLPAFMVPTWFVFLRALPLTANGKVDRRRLPDPQRERSGLGGAGGAPTTELEIRIAKVWQEVLGIEKVGLRDNFFDLGGHSMLLLQIQHRLDRILRRSLSLVDLFRSPTIEALVQHLEEDRKGGATLTEVLRTQNRGHSNGSPLVPLRQDGDRPPLLAVHPASGEILCYQELTRLLGFRQPVYGLRDPALQDGRDDTTSIEALADFYLESARREVGAAPYAFVGYSFGGLVAFEMARQQKAAGKEVPLLAILDSVSPSMVQRNFPDADYSRLLAIIAREVMGDAEVGVDELAGQLRHEDREVALDRAVDRILEPRQAADSDVRRKTRDFLRDHVDVFAARVEMGRHYDPPPLPGDLLFFLSHETLVQVESNGGALHYGWGEMCTGNVEIHEVPSAHATMLSPPHVKKVAEVLAYHLWGGS